MFSRISSRASISRNATILMICNALFICSISIDLALTGIVGFQLTPIPMLATLPFALITVGAATTTWGAAGLMQRVGRQAGFMIGTSLGVMGGVISVWAVLHGHFWVFCLGTFMVGVWQAFAQYYRLAAADNVSEEDKSKAISWVLAGGLIAALIGPALANWSRGWLGDPFFAGAYVAVTCLALTSLILLLFYRDEANFRTRAHVLGRSVAFGDLLSRPIYQAAVVNSTVSGVVMMFLMTGAPIAALGCGLGVEDSTSIIQWHLVGMYGPSFFVGILISRYGLVRIMHVGNLLTFVSVVLAVASQTTFAFHAALLTLGVGWNFMFVGGTTLLAKSHTTDEQARAQGFAEFLRFGGTALGAVAAGPLLQSMGWQIMNIIVLPLLAAALWFTIKWDGKTTGDQMNG
ncbi:MFS transporter [Aureimonas ureilytica]|uniref:MFS transporter n=2 Tax=Aureimonas ureilytica TaxID=401562 RepID=A0A175QUA1_9HYPH|nr:MFS transporter [Aureimonas ureilytica]